MRTYYSIKFTLTGDATYYETAVYLWSVAEVTLGIFCGCLPVLPALFRRLSETLSTYGSQKRGSAQADSHVRPSSSSNQRRWDVEGQYLELSDKKPLASSRIDHQYFAPTRSVLCPRSEA